MSLEFTINKAEYYSLADAAKIIECRESDLLHFATLGKMTLLTKIPDDVDLLTLKLAFGYSLPNGLSKAQFLCLSRQDCIQIELTGKAVQRNFDCAYSNLNLFAQMKQYLACNEDPEFTNRIFWSTIQVIQTPRATYLDSLNPSSTHLKPAHFNPVSLVLAHDNLFVLQSDLDSIKNFLSSLKSNVNSLIPKSYYPLSYVAEITKCNLADILEYASNGEITLLAGIPTELNIKVVNLNTGKRCSTYPFFWPQLLVATKTNCEQIMREGKTTQSDFAEGYYINESGEIKSSTPSKICSTSQSSGSSVMCFRTFQRKIFKSNPNSKQPQLSLAKLTRPYLLQFIERWQQSSLSLTKENLFLSHNGLIKFAKHFDDRAPVKSNIQSSPNQYLQNSAVIAVKVESIREESPSERSSRLLKRKGELIANGVKNFNKTLATEEGVSVSRVKQLLSTVKDKSKAKGNSVSKNAYGQLAANPSKQSNLKY